MPDFYGVLCVVLFLKNIAREALRKRVIQVVSRKSKAWCPESPEEAFPRWAVGRGQFPGPQRVRRQKGRSEEGGPMGL